MLFLSCNYYHLESFHLIKRRKVGADSKFQIQNFIQQLVNVNINKKVLDQTLDQVSKT